MNISSFYNICSFIKFEMANMSVSAKMTGQWTRQMSNMSGLWVFEKSDATNAKCKRAQERGARWDMNIA